MNALQISKGSKARLAGLAVIAALLASWIISGLAQQGQQVRVDINALIHETQKTSQYASEMTLVWWIPEEYWRVSCAQDATIPSAQVEQLIKVMRPYTLVIVVDGRRGPGGTIAYTSEAVIRATIAMKDRNGTVYHPLGEDKVGDEVRQFLSIMKPILAGGLGPMGQNMHFFLFPAANQKGEPIAPPKKEGAFSIRLAGREFRWRLPLGSLLASKICPGCKEKCSGAWNFCPWCGTMLPKRI
jgi:hypothetical protein